MNKLSTHVLDLFHGLPAVGMEICLYFEGPSTPRTLMCMTQTNRDGRTDSPLLIGNSFQIGTYDLIFSVGAYFQAKQVNLPYPAFLDLVPIRFGIADHQLSYHVPLLVSPWGYSTYRGS